MRIALFTETYLPSINGVVTHVKTLKEGLEALGHTVLVVTADSRVNNHVIADDVMYCPAVKLKKIYNYDIALPPETHQPLAADAQRAHRKCLRTQSAGGDGRPCAGGN